MVVKMYLEPACEVMFHNGSYGYRPERSAHMAVEQARIRCLQYSWVIDLDIKSFFDTINHDLLIKAVKRHTTEPWILLYIKRWLQAPVQTVTGDVEPREVGTPQGSVISPLLANLFLHYVFDTWMDKYIPYCPFERYADDIIVHCSSLTQANYILCELRKRFSECKLTLHPEKTTIVYCKFGKSKRVGEEHPNVSFDFLGFTFKPRSQRKVIKRVADYWSFTPGMSGKSKVAVMDKVRQWELKHRIKLSLSEIAEWINPMIRGWIQYYGAFWRSALDQIFHLINMHLINWFKAKYRVKVNGRAWEWLKKVINRQPDLFEHWKLRNVAAGQ
jgi:RNA-directed DNA polymerase